VKIQSFQQYVNTPLPHLPWIIPGLIPADGWTLLQAPPKTGKSIFAIQVADSLTRGQHFLAWGNGLPFHGDHYTYATVVYIQADEPPGDWHQQLAQLGMYTSSPNALTIDRASTGLFVMDDPLKRHKLKALLAPLKPHLVIWDSLEKLTMQDLNTKEGCQRILKVIEEVWGGPRLVIHHPRKMKEGSFWGNLDEVAGNHYLSADASSILTLRKTGSLSGRLRILGRMADSEWDLVRSSKDYRWTKATKVVKAADPTTADEQPQTSDESAPGTGSGLYVEPQP